MSATDGPVLWPCGVTGVGKSTVGYAVYRRAVSAGLMAAYVDLDQIGFRNHAPLRDATVGTKIGCAGRLAGRGWLGLGRRDVDLAARTEAAGAVSRA